MVRFGAKRSQNTRDTLPIVMVICDDTRTAPAYFSELRPVVKGSCTLKILPASRHGVTGETLLDYAVTERNKLSDVEGVTVWVLVDLEMKSDSDATAAALLEKSQQQGVNIALSQPCFEVWILHHFLDTGEMFTSCGAVLKKIKREWKARFSQDFPSKKAQADYRKLLDLIHEASTRSRTHNTDNSQAWTDVWRVVDDALPQKRI
jgi:hypothetical protein